MIRALLIDDEKPATELLEMKLKRLNMDVQVIAKFNQPEAAVEFIRVTEFDLLFLDIEMPRLNGFDLLAQFDAYHFDVIFTTAYDQYAIRAFRVSALSYLLKPIEEHDLREAVSRWQKKQVKQLQTPQMLALKTQLGASSLPPTRLALPTHEGHEIIEIEQIIRCMADASYTHFYLADGQQLLICRTLKEVEQALTSSGFIRTHLSHLINPQYLKKIVKQEGGYLVMTDGAQVPVTKQKRDLLVEQFNVMGRG
jgi:two-component system, LytTR family, response regulator